MRTGLSLTSEITTTILELADGSACRPYRVSEYADREAAVRAGTPKGRKSPSPGSSSDQKLGKGKEATLNEPMSEESAVDVENAVSSHSGSQSRDTTSVTRQSGETSSSKDKDRQRPPLRSAQSMTSANRWRSLNGNAPAKAPTNGGGSEKESEVADDLNVGLFRRMIVEDLEASSVALGSVVDQSDDKLWQDPVWRDSDEILVKPYWKGDEFGGH